MKRDDRSHSLAGILARLGGISVVGITVTLLSTFVGERRARAVYPDIMSCETGCSVVATGWPFLFVRDYLGMSVGNTADITEVWFAADRFDWLPFLVNVLIWSMFALLAWRGFGEITTVSSSSSDEQIC